MISHYITLEELMRKLQAQLFADLANALGILQMAVFSAHVASSGSYNRDEIKSLGQRLGKTLRDVKNECNAAGLKLSEIILDKMITLAMNPPVNMDEMARLGVELQGRILDEMTLQIFIQIEADKAKPLTERDLFGVNVGQAFPSAIIDIEEAGKCLAFERWTASVFHLMRVMELALRVLGDTLKLPPTTNRNWETILKKCDDELKKPLADRSPEWKSDDPFFAGVAAMLRSVKDAWRNPTMHVGPVYTEEQAEDIWNAVKGFMRHLATKLKE